jgi:hypothetical protein
MVLLLLRFLRSSLLPLLLLHRLPFLLLRGFTEHLL